MRRLLGRFPNSCSAGSTVVAQKRSVFDSMLPPLIMTQDDLLLSDWKELVGDENYDRTTPPNAGDPHFRRLYIKGTNSRVFADFFVTLNGVSRWVPAIVDTGAPCGLALSPKELGFFKISVVGEEGNQMQRQQLETDRMRSFLEGSVGVWTGQVSVTPKLSAGGVAVREANLVGMQLVGEGIKDHFENHFNQRLGGISPISTWVSVTLPDKTVEVVDITTAVKNGEVTSNISGLKKAVLKELGLNHQGKFTQHLTVYPPGKKKDGKELDVGDALKSASRDEPYHVEVK